MLTALRCGSRAIRVMLVVSAVCGCREANQFAPPPPPSVTVQQPIHETVTTDREFVGRTAPVASVDVRARVRGFLRTVEFTEGGEVRAGDLLYTIEPEEYEAALDAALAVEAEAQAEFTRAEAEFERISRLFESNTAAETEFNNARAMFERARAARQSGAAQVAQARLNLGYTKITAPIAGRINRSRIDAGNLVGAGDATLLTSIVPWDPIHVYFTVDERTVLEFRRLRKDDDLPEHVEVWLTLADATEYPRPGAIDYADNRVDPDTGTIRVRAVVPNPDSLLVPGVFARVRVPREAQEALLVPETALQRDLVGDFLLIVNGAGEVERRGVELGERTGGRRIVMSGLTGNERVIVKGLQRVRPGVTPNVEMAAAATGATTAPSGE